ncbi:MAG: hypothetical protein H6739_18980 [Alphaproteobacteria bacterium]|nr:hypothetical protein [Alphaproteobacteria bacterium]
MLPLLLALSSPAVAADRVSPDASVQGAITFVRVGMNADLRGGVKLDLWSKEGSTLFSDTYLKVHAAAIASPAYVRAGGRVSFEPIALLNVSAFAFYNAYFGNFQTVIGFDDPAFNYGTNDDLEAYEDNQGTGGGLSWGVSPTLKARGGPIIVLLNAEYSQWYVTAPDVTGDYWFEREYELMIGMNKDAILTSNNLLLFEWDWNPEDRMFLRVGSITRYRRALGDTEDALLRTGLIAQFSTKDGHLVHTLLASAYLKDRAYTKPFPPFLAYTIKWTL